MKINDPYKPQLTSPLLNKKRAGKWQNTLSDATIRHQSPTLKWPQKSYPKVWQVPTLEKVKEPTLKFCLHVPSGKHPP